jgi:hypothetical protein
MVLNLGLETVKGAQSFSQSLAPRPVFYWRIRMSEKRKRYPIACPECGNIFQRLKKQVNAVVRRSGKWNCKRCVLVRRNKSMSKRILGDTWIVEGRIWEKSESGWKKRSRLVVERRIGRKLNPDEIVHHINGNKRDDEFENLMLLSRGEHTTLHCLGRMVSRETRSKISKSRTNYYSKRRNNVKSMA